MTQSTSLLLMFILLFRGLSAFSPEENIYIPRKEEGLVDGDIKLTRKQRMILNGQRTGANFGRWPNGVLVYKIDASLQSEARAMSAIQKAFNDWTSKTCITFKRRTTETAYVSFFKGSGCWSYVGRTGKKQQLSLAKGCWSKGVVVHEIGHALGFFHEQSRPDRDEYVKIKWKNIIKGRERNFKKYTSIDSKGTPYDYGSVMHYGSKYFSKNGQPTIIAKKSGVTLGQRNGLSSIDAKQINLMYNCATETVAPPTVNPSTGSLCTFESGLCTGWSQSTDDKFDWTVRTGTTPSSGTGPVSGHGGTGSYIYIETSSPRVAGDNAKIELDVPGSGNVVCLTFFYHMRGSSVGTLRVFSGNAVVFIKSGSQGDSWLKAEVSLSLSNKLIIEGVRGASWSGDIAIDDVAMKEGSCASPPTVGPTPPPPQPGSCGSRPNSRIVGGTAAPVNSWPWQAMLITRSGRQFCGGSLVHPRFVVTAAHCVPRGNPSNLKVKMGAHYRVRGSVGTEQTIDVVQIIRHESYQNPLAFSNDIALLKLAQPVVTGRGVGLICIPDGTKPLPINQPNKKCWITGWGTLSSGGSQPNQLMQASVPLVSKQRCLSSYPGNIDNSMLCAGLDQGGVDACQGDSGGPLVCEYNGEWNLEGATSWGHGCAAPKKYGVYAKIRNFRAWLSNKMGLLPPSPPPPVTTPSPKPPSASGCSFENGLCAGWSQSTTDKFDWTVGTDNTPSPGTGPVSGHGGSGKYLFIETSSPRVAGDDARIEWSVSGTGTACLRFFYSMYGSNMGTLNVLTGDKLVFTRSGDQGISWQKAEVTLNLNHKITFEGIRGNSFRGDAAIDDVSISFGNCESVTPPPATVGPTPACKDDPAVASVCPSIASCGNLCNDHKQWATKNCAKSCNICDVPPSASCGVSPVTRVIGGVDANPGNWPWQVALLRGASKSFSCGGSLIAPDWIVTAAHCIANGQPGSFYTIRLGDHNRNTDEGTEEDIPGKRIIVHPNYGTPTLNNDIAMIQLIRPAKLSARVRTVCLPSHDEAVPTTSRCFITGWGKIKHPGSSHNILQQAEMPPVTNSECAAKLAASPGGSSLTITDHMICAGVQNTTLSGCHGDSGGPYVCQTAAGNWVLQGAVSWGSPRCSAAERYTVFARVAKFRGWIDAQMST